jgi:hypothetical protein
MGRHREERTAKQEIADVIRWAFFNIAEALRRALADISDK